MATTRNRRSAAVPTRPENTKYGAALQSYAARGTNSSAADHKPTTPAVTLIQKAA
jgi:hypothetical protein